MGDGARSRLALYPDLPTHGLYKFAAQGQAEAGATEPPAHTLVRLGKGLKALLARGAVDTDPPVMLHTSNQSEHWGSLKKMDTPTG